MSILAVQVICKMRGGSQSQLVVGDDDNFWVVKFQNNPQHLRVLANEMIVTKLADKIGLSVPLTAVIEVSPHLLRGVRYEKEAGACRSYDSGLQFGSQLIGGAMPGKRFDYLPLDDLLNVTNLNEFAGILCLDKWTNNCDGRQVVFSRRKKTECFKATFIDQGLCFGGGDWIFLDAPLRGRYAVNGVYSGVTGWDCFEPWLSRIEGMEPEALWKIAEAVPPEWYEGNRPALERLVERALSRRSKVRDFITMFRNSNVRPFPQWH